VDESLMGRGEKECWRGERGSMEDEVVDALEWRLEVELEDFRDRESDGKEISDGVGGVGNWDALLRDGGRTLALERGRLTGMGAMMAAAGSKGEERDCVLGRRTGVGPGRATGVASWERSTLAFNCGVLLFPPVTGEERLLAGAVVVLGVSTLRCDRPSMALWCSTRRRACKAGWESILNRIDSNGRVRR
jgi:hypothetical protein